MESKHQTVLLFGPPGAGKGTQGRILGNIPGFYHSSCGDVFRQLSPNSELGQLFLKHSSTGGLVPDEVTIKIWHAHIRAMHATQAYKPAEDLLILDGIPRSVKQAELLSEELEILKVISLECRDQDRMIERLRRRALKENRIDDTKESIIRHRWEVYEAETAPVLEHYSSDNVARVDAMVSPAEVLSQILEILVPIQNAHFRKLKTAS